MPTSSRAEHYDALERFLAKIGDFLGARTREELVELARAERRRSQRNFEGDTVVAREELERIEGYARFLQLPPPRVDVPLDGVAHLATVRALTLLLRLLSPAQREVLRRFR